MKCGKCGAGATDTARYCDRCGASLIQLSRAGKVFTVVFTGIGGGILGVLSGIWLIILGITLCATGVGVIAGIPLILGGIISPFFGAGMFSLVGIGTMLKQHPPQQGAPTGLSNRIPTPNIGVASTPKRKSNTWRYVVVSLALLALLLVLLGSFAPHRSRYAPAVLPTPETSAIPVRADLDAADAVTALKNASFGDGVWGMTNYRAEMIAVRGKGNYVVRGRLNRSDEWFGGTPYGTPDAAIRAMRAGGGIESFRKWVNGRPVE